MKIPVAALKQYAIDTNIPMPFFEQFQDYFEGYALRVATAQRKKDIQAIRAWYFNPDLNKPQLFEILSDVDHQ